MKYRKRIYYTEADIGGNGQQPLVFWNAHVAVQLQVRVIRKS